MSGFQILAPLGLAALVAVPLIVLYHMRHTTPVERPVPTLRFWLKAMDQQTEQVRFRRPPINLLLLLHLIIVGLIAFALARPAATDAWAGLGRRTDPTHVIILLDGSTSMAATDTASGRTRYEEARANALARVSDLHEGDVATVVLLGTHPTTLEATDAAGLKALRDRLGRIEAPGGRADLNAALRLARDLVLPNLDDQVVLISDGALSADPTLVESVGAPIAFARVGRAETANLAITDLTARGSPANPDQIQLYARMVNFGSEQQTAKLIVTADGLPVEERELTIAADDDSEQIITDLPAGAAKVTLTLQANDALLADNTASLVLARNTDLGLRILLVSDTPGPLQRALAVLPGALLTTESTTDDLTGTGEAANKGPFDLVVYENYSPLETNLPDSPAVFAGPPRDGLLQTLGMMTKPVVTSIRAQDPLIQGVELAGVSFGDTPVHVMDGTQTAIVSAADGPLIYRGTLAATGQSMIVLTFDVDESNLTRRVAFPILIANIAGELAPGPLPSAAPLGDPLRYRPRADAATVRVTPPRGDPIDLSVAVDGVANADATNPAPAGTSERLREIVYADTGRAGDYQITELDAAGNPLGGGTFVVNAGHPRESNLRANQDLPGLLATAKTLGETGSSRSLSDLWPSLVALTLGVLAFEWLWSVLPRRRRRRVAVSQVVLRPR